MVPRSIVIVDLFDYLLILVEVFLGDDTIGEQVLSQVQKVLPVQTLEPELKVLTLVQKTSQALTKALQMM